MTLYDEKNLHVAVTENKKQLTARSMFKRCVRVVKCRYDISTQRTSGVNGYQTPQQRSVHLLPKVFLLDETKPRPEPENKETAR